MNHTMYSADKSTHLKVVVMSVVLAIMFTVGGLAVKVSGHDLQTAKMVNPTVVKTVKPVVWTSASTSVVQ